MIPHEAKGLVNTAALHCTAVQHGRKRRLRKGGVFRFAFFLSHSGLFRSRNVGKMDVCFALWVDHTALYGWIVYGGAVQLHEGILAIDGFP